MEKYVGLIEADDLSNLLGALQEEIPFERAVLHLPPEDPIVWIEDDELIEDFPLTEAIWEKAIKTSRGLVGFDQPNLEAVGTGGTLNVNSVRVCLCRTLTDDEDKVVARMLFDRRCSALDFNEEQEELVDRILEHIGATRIS